MQGLKKVLNILHRRRRPIEDQKWWEKLNYAQKFSAHSLDQLGYEICFIRNDENSSLVVMTRDGHDITIDEDGNIDTNPDLVHRK